MSAGERQLYGSPHNPASRAGRWAFSRLSGESENLSASESRHRGTHYSVGRYMFLLILGTTYKIGRAGGVFTGTPPALLYFSAKLPAASPAQLPAYLARFHCPVGLLWSTNLHVGSVRLPGRLLLLAYPCGWHDSTNLLDRSIRHSVWPAAWHVSPNPLVGSGPLPDWPGRLLCPCHN